MASYLCPVCRAPMQRELSGRIPKKSFLQIGLLTAFVAGLAYLTLGSVAALKSSLFFFPLWAVVEFVHALKMREEAHCRVCDFDPLLYRRDWKAARRKVEARMERLSGELQQKIRARIEQVEASRKALQTAPNSAQPPAQNS